MLILVLFVFSYFNFVLYFLKFERAQCNLSSILIEYSLDIINIDGIGNSGILVGLSIHVKKWLGSAIATSFTGL